MCDRVLPILDSSMQADAYTIMCFSEMSLTRSDIFSGLIVLTPPHECSAYPIPSIFEVTLQGTKPGNFVDGNEYF